MSNPLTDALSPKARKVLYAVVFLVGLAITAWQASDGNWKVAVGTFVASLVPLLAHGNVTPAQVEGD